MMTNFKKYWAVAKVNFKCTTWVAYLVAAICMAAVAVDMVLDRTLNNVGDASIAIYSILSLICILAPIFIASVNYAKLTNIGVKKKQFFYGCMINYLVFAAAISLLGVLETYLLDGYLNASGSTVYGLIEVFGWNSNIFTAFFSQFAFLLLTESIIHTLTFMQTKWYGWVADVVIVAIISVFTPIPVLRQAEVRFFNQIIFAKPAIIQIASCLALSVGFYLTNLFYLKMRDS